MKNGDKDFAFPIPSEMIIQISEGGGCPDNYMGLTKREYFAAMALQGLLAGNILTADRTPKNVAHLAVVCADRLIADLNES